MARNIFQPLQINTFDTNCIDCKPQPSTYFELVYVAGGSGMRVVNGHELPFRKGHLFLHLPLECNAIYLHEHSTLHFIKFQRVLFDLSRKGKEDPSFREWFRCVEFIFFSNKDMEEHLIRDAADNETVGHLVQFLVREYNSRGMCFDLNLKAALLILLNITARNIAGQPVGNAVHDEEKDILNYINYHIYDADSITLKRLAEVFSISPTYFSEYFRRRYGMPLKQYILEYKLKLAETRLQYTQLSLKEIAAELQFTDTSHLNRMFRKYKGIAPRDVRAQ